METAAIVSMEDLRRIREATVPVKNVLLEAPTLDDEIVDFILDRSRDTGREIDW